MRISIFDGLIQGRVYIRGWGGGEMGAYNLLFFAVRYPSFLANEIVSFAARYFTTRIAQPDRCGLQITIRKKFKMCVLHFVLARGAYIRGGGLIFGEELIFEGLILAVWTM